VRAANCGLAECHAQLGDTVAAREAFNKALGEKRTDADLDEVVERALVGLAALALKQNDAPAAKKLALRILVEHPDSPWAAAAYLAAGQASESGNEPEKAIGYYRKLLAAQPNSPQAPIASERLKALGAPQ
jgi:tetratricopeptide (TPR) repeat protein